MYDLANLPVTERSKEQHLDQINGVLTLAPNDQHNAALANILKANYFLLQDDFKKAKQFLIKSKPIVDLIKSDKLTSEYQFAEIFLLRSNSEIDKAIDIGNKLYNNVIESWPKHKLSHLVLELAYLRYFEYKYDDSLEYLKLALDYSYESDDPYQIAETYNMFGIIYSELNDAVSANNYYLKAVEKVEKHPELFKNTYLYSNLADSYRELKQYQITRKYLDQAETIAQQDNDIAAVAFAHQIRSRLLVDEKNYEEALGYLLRAAETANEIGEKLFNYEIHSELSYVYLKLEQLDNAQKHLDIAAENSGKQGDTYKFYMERIQARIFYKTGEYQEAFDALVSSHDNYIDKFNDDLTRVSNLSREQLDQAQLNYDNKLLARENELNAKSAEDHQRYNLLLWFLIGILIFLMAIMIWFIYRFRKLAIKNKKLALTDNLTRMPNRRFIFGKLAQYHNKTIKSNFSYSLIVFDIDHFKAINDRFGHNIGDKVIQATKGICRSILRAEDTIGRIGGEEFLILLPKINIDDAHLIAERIREQFEIYDFENLANGLQVTASFGVTEVCAEDQNIDFLVNRADRLMYKAKHEGRNKVIAQLI